MMTAVMNGSPTAPLAPSGVPAPHFGAAAGPTSTAFGDPQRSPNDLSARVSGQRLPGVDERSAPQPDAPPGGPHSRASRRTHRPNGRSLRRSSTLPVRRLVVGVLVGAATMFSVAVLDTVTGTQVPVLGSFAALPAAVAEPDVIEVPAPPAVPGTCLNWTRPDAADTAVVDCSQPHLFEQAGAVELADQAQLPDDGTWRQLVNERCTPVVVSYLNGKFDPNGKFRVGALKPSAARWAQGDRQLRCGLQSSSRSGALYPIVGKVAEQDQSAVHEPGTCLGIDGRTIGDPVDCSGTHAVETVGIVDLSTKFPDAFPAVEEQDKFLQPECSRIAEEYAGGPGIVEAKKLTVYWDNVTEASWAAGARRVNCNLAALLPDRSGFAPITGSVRGDVAVGETPAPPASNTPDPGVPAPPTTPTAEPPTTSTVEPEPSAPPTENPEPTTPSPSEPTSTEPPPVEQTPGPTQPTPAPGPPDATSP